MAKKSEAQEGFEILEGLEGLRKNPSMYLGETGAPMAEHAIKEVVDNAYDEHIAGRNTYIEVVVNYDTRTIVVADGAGGIPTDFKKLKDGTKISILTAAFTRLHAGGKFNNKAYKTSAGTHGIGVSAVNAVSEELRVWSTFNGKLAFQSYSKGEITSKGDHPIQVKAIDKDVRSLLLHKMNDYGTVVAFKLDQTVVSESAKRGQKLPKNFVEARPRFQETGEMLRDIAYFNPGLKIVYKTVRKDKEKVFTFFNKKGLAWVPKVMCETREITPMGKPLVHKSDNITLCVVWANHPDVNNFKTYVNTSTTRDGGWHVTGFMTALAQALKPYMKEKKSKKSKKSTAFSSRDLLIGLTGMLVYRMHGAQFTAQTKDKLASRVDREVHEELFPVLDAYFKANKKVAKDIIKRATVMNKGREELAEVVKNMAEVKKAAKGNALPSALKLAPDCDPMKRELFIVEGDSAEKTAIDARDSSFQEVLGAKGKPRNALTSSLAEVLAHEEIQNMLIALGADIKTLDPKSENPRLSSDNLRTRHVIFLTDPDPDGYHISVLFIAAIYRLLPDMFKQGRVWCVDAPLFGALHNGTVYRGMTFNECRKNAPKEVRDRDIVRIKGWGEVDERWLEPIAFSQEKRRLIQINPFKNAEAEQFFLGVVAEDAVHRRRLLGLESNTPREE